MKSPGIVVWLLWELFFGLYYNSEDIKYRINHLLHSSEHDMAEIFHSQALFSLACGS